MLDELSVSELGIGFIYSVLDLWSSATNLTDAVVVLVHESFGTQMFAPGPHRVSADSRVPRCRRRGLLRARRGARRRARRGAHGLSVGALVAPRALQRGPRSADQHRQSPHL
jgi:hypothetical protein